MTFISAHVQPLAHTQHGKHFTISPAGLLRYTPHSTQKHPRRIASRDLLDISPDIIQLDTLVGNLIDAHGRLLLDGIWYLTQQHQLQWHTDLQILGRDALPTTEPSTPTTTLTQHNSNSNPTPTDHATPPGPRTQAPKPRPNVTQPKNKPTKHPQAMTPPPPTYLISADRGQPAPGSIELTRGAFSTQDATDPTITPMHTMLQYHAYHLPPSDYLYVEGIPSDIRGSEIPGMIQHIAYELQIPLNQMAAITQLTEDLRRGHIQRIPNNQLATTIPTGHHNFPFGHHHSPINRLAVRIFSCRFHRPEMMQWNPV